MGFRSCVRYFRGTILKLLPPLLPWCFPIWEVLLDGRCRRNSSSSSKRKKALRPFFFMGFRRYVGHFRGASLMLLCPLLPWCFPRTCSRSRSSRRNRKCSRSSSSSRNKEFKSFFSLGFRSYVKHLQGTIFGLLRPSLPLCFPIREVPFQQNVYQQKE